MGGANQAVCPPPSQSVKLADSVARTSSLLAAKNPIRFHENGGEVHFHDDQGGLKCALPSAVFFKEYHDWRPKMTSELVLMGHDGQGGHASARLIPYVDDRDVIQVATVVSRVAVGSTVADLDVLAKY